MGHDVIVHREFYRLPEDTLQLAKMSRLLMAMDKGAISKFTGQRLEDISVDMPDMNLSEDSAVDDDENAEINQSGSNDSDSLDSIGVRPKKRNAKGKRSHGKKSKQIQRDFLSSQEIASISSYFQADINSLKLPGKAKCETFLKKDSLFKNSQRSWLKVKATVRNLIKAQKKFKQIRV